MKTAKKTKPKTKPSAEQQEQIAEWRLIERRIMRAQYLFGKIEEAMHDRAAFERLNAYCLTALKEIIANQVRFLSEINALVYCTKPVHEKAVEDLKKIASQLDSDLDKSMLHVVLKDHITFGKDS